VAYRLVSLVGSPPLRSGVVLPSPASDQPLAPSLAGCSDGSSKDPCAAGTPVVRLAGAPFPLPLDQVRGSLVAPPHYRALRMRREAPDIGVAKAGRTLVNRVGCLFLGHAFTQVHPPLVDRWADDPVADVVPHRHAVVIRCVGVDVVAEKLGLEVVL
jgi:hypothetical protein